MNIKNKKPSWVGSRGKAPEIFGYFAFWIAENIALVAHELPFVYF